MFCAALAAGAPRRREEHSGARATTERSAATLATVAVRRFRDRCWISRNEACRALFLAPLADDGPPRGAFPATRTVTPWRCMRNFRLHAGRGGPHAPRNAPTATPPPAGPVGVDGSRRAAPPCRRAPAARCAARRGRGENIFSIKPRGRPKRRAPSPRRRQPPRRGCPSASQRSPIPQPISWSPLLPVAAPPQNGCNGAARGAARPRSPTRPAPRAVRRNCWTSGKKGKCG